MKSRSIGITAWGSLSPLGCSQDEVWSAYNDDRHRLSAEEFLVGRLAPSARKCAADMGRKYHRLDPSVWYGLAAARQAVEGAGWIDFRKIGVFVGSSRGATSSWEKGYEEWRSTGKVTPLTSPTTTIGSVSSWIGQDLGTDGLCMSHSVTCSTALHAIMQAMTWIESGRARRMLAGGVESPNTPFTRAQMKALRILASDERADYPCRALDLNKTNNTMVLGEGSAVFALEADPKEPLAWITGVGYGMETIDSPTGISAEGIGLQHAMGMALNEAQMDTVDAIVTHAPGTRMGDMAEWRAIREVFGDSPPSLTNNKWKLGHSLGASGGLSLELALLMLLNNRFVHIPYLSLTVPARLETIMVNAIGFGGNAISLVLKKAKKGYKGEF